MHFSNLSTGMNYTTKKFFRHLNLPSAEPMMRFILTTNSLLKHLKVWIKNFISKNVELITYFSDSPCVPPSANAHELFRGFSFVAPCLIGDEDVASCQQASQASTKPTEPYSKVLHCFVLDFFENKTNKYTFVYK